MKKRKKTELGRTLAKIRIDFDQTGADMAKKLGISSSQMFNIEVGLAQVGYEFIGKVKEVYEVDLTEIMRRGGFVSKITLDLDELSQKDKEIVLAIWSRKWDNESTKDNPGTFTEAVGEAIPKPKPPQDSAQPEDTAGARKSRGRPRTIRASDEVGFLDEESAEDLDGLEEVDVL